MLARCILPMDLGGRNLALSMDAREIGQSQEKALWIYWPRDGKGGERWIGG